MSGLLFALGGATAGVAQAGDIARSARRGPRTLAGVARLMLVGAVLFVAARSGGLALAAVGWGIGFAAAVVVLRRRLR